MQCVFGCLLLLRGGLTRFVLAPSGVIFPVPRCLPSCIESPKYRKLYRHREGSVRCPRCGNENSEENRFCGMCGAKLLAAPAVVASTPVAVAASSAPVAAARSSSSLSSPPARPQVVAPSRSAPISEDSSFISGPSFLGLNDPAPRKRGALNTDAQSNSSNLDY